MAHVYASVAEFNDFLRDNGAATYTTETAAMVGRKLAVLAGASHTIDEHAERSSYGSGFGPRTGTNRYDGNGHFVLRLEDDLLSLTSLKVYDGTAGTPTTHTVETDFYLDPYDSTPKRRIIAHGQGSLSTFTFGHRTVDVAGTFGYEDRRRTATATTSEALDASETGVDVSAATEFSPGQTLLIDSEQMYIRSISTNTLTVERGANGTTAATHLTAVAISIYEYHPLVVDGSLRIALRRWKARDAGGDGSDGGGDMPMIRGQSERTILRETVGRLRLPSIY